MLLTPKEVTVKLGVSEETLRVWRRKKTGPPVIALSERVFRYRLEDIEGWLEDQTDHPVDT